MKLIELTEEHKSKLLEMCEVLFPTAKVDYIRDGMIQFLVNYHESKHISKSYFTGWDKTERIHWFEFVMTHLFLALFNKMFNFDHMLTADLGEEVLTDAEMALMMRAVFMVNNPDRDDMHPVNYLYGEFKKIK